MTAPVKPVGSLIFQEVVTAYYAALGEADKSKVLKLISPDIVHSFNHAPVEVGISAFEKFLDLKMSMYEETFQQLRIYSEASGTRGAAEFQLTGRYIKTYPGLPQATGQNYSIPVGAFLEVKSGQLSRITTLFNFDEWLRQISKV